MTLRGTGNVSRMPGSNSSRIRLTTVPYGSRHSRIRMAIWCSCFNLQERLEPTRHHGACHDVWMIARLRDRRPDSMPVAGNWYGTTLRAYDPVLDAWRIFWIDPATDVGPSADRPGRALGHRSGRHDRVGLALTVAFHEDRGAIVSTASARSQPTTARPGGFMIPG